MRMEEGHGVWIYFRKEIPYELLGISTLVIFNQNFSYEGDEARYATSVVPKYLDTSRVKASKNVYKTNFAFDITFAKSDASTGDEQVEKLTRDLNIHYIACTGS